MVKAKGMAKHAAKVPEYAVLNLRKLPVEIKESLRDEAARLGTTMDALCALYLAEGLERARETAHPERVGCGWAKNFEHARRGAAGVWRGGGDGIVRGDCGRSDGGPRPARAPGGCDV